MCLCPENMPLFLSPAPAGRENHHLAPIDAEEPSLRHFRQSGRSRYGSKCPPRFSIFCRKNQQTQMLLIAKAIWRIYFLLFSHPDIYIVLFRNPCYISMPASSLQERIISAGNSRILAILSMESPSFNILLAVSLLGSDRPLHGSPHGSSAKSPLHYIL